MLPRLKIFQTTDMSISSNEVSASVWFGYRAKINIRYSLPSDILVKDAICERCKHSLSDMANWGPDIDKCYNGETHIFKA